MSGKIAIFCLSLTAITVQCAVINQDVLQRLPRSPCYSCGMTSPQLLPPPPPSPYFRTQHWSGYGRSIDGTQQGVFSGAAAAVGGSQAAGEAFSLASADKSNGNYGAPQPDNNRQDQDGNKFKVTQYHYGSESHGSSDGSEANSKAVKEDSSAQVPISTGSLAQSSENSDASNVKSQDNEQQVQLNNWHQSHGYGSPHIQKDNKPDLPPQVPSETPKHDATYFESNSDKTAQNSGQYHHDSSQVNRGDMGQEVPQTSSGYSSKGSAGAASSTQEGQVSQVSTLEADPKPQVPQLVRSYGTKSGAYSGSGYQSGGSNSQSSLGYSSGAGYGHGYQGYQQQQQQQQVSGGSGYSHGANGATANGQGYSGYQDTLKDALSLASQGLETSRQAGGAAGAGGAGCPSCGQGGSYALSNARSHTGNAVALSIGG